MAKFHPCTKIEALELITKIWCIWLCPWNDPNVKCGENLYTWDFETRG